MCVHIYIYIYMYTHIHTQGILPITSRYALTTHSSQVGSTSGADCLVLASRRRIFSVTLGDSSAGKAQFQWIETPFFGWKNRRWNALICKKSLSGTTLELQSNSKNRCCAVAVLKLPKLTRIDAAEDHESHHGGGDPHWGQTGEPASCGWETVTWWSKDWVLGSSWEVNGLWLCSQRSWF